MRQDEKPNVVPERALLDHLRRQICGSETELLEGARIGIDGFEKPGLGLE